MDAMAFTVRGEGSETLELDVYDVIADSWMGGVSARAVRAAIKNSAAKLIKVRINSGGGDVFQAYAIYNLLAQSKARVEVSIDALAASAASVLAMAGDDISIGANAWVMIHNPTGALAGEAQELRDWADVLDKIRMQIADTYVARSGGKLDQAKALELMAAETWMDAGQAKKYGLVDSITPLKGGSAKASARAFASLSVRGHEHVPEEVRRAIEASKAASLEDEPPTAEDGAVPYKKYPLQESGGWDAAAATQRIRKWASSDGTGSESTIDWAKYQNAFAWVDPAKKESLGSYKLPHHDVVDGKLVTVRAGVIAAGNVMAGGRGGTNIPEADAASVKSHLAKHYAEFKLKAPWEADNAVAGDRASTQGKKTMNIEEIKAQHPELYAAILNEGKAAGRKEGETSERDRVTAHLTLGEQSGDMKTALAAIASGEGMTQTITAKYMAAGMNRSAVNTRQAESDAAGAATAGAAPAAAAATKDLGDEVADRMARARGKTV